MGIFGGAEDFLNETLGCFHKLLMRHLEARLIQEGALMGLCEIVAIARHQAGFERTATQNLG